MNHVTRGLGKRSGMCATMGLGRRVLIYIEQIGIYFAALSRPWATSPPSRAWSFDASRVWAALADTRSWAIYRGQRAWSFVTSTRSWIRSKVRAWKGSTDRSWSQYVD